MAGNNTSRATRGSAAVAVFDSRFFKCLDRVGEKLHKGRATGLNLQHGLVSTGQRARGTHQTKADQEAIGRMLDSGQRREAIEKYGLMAVLSAISVEYNETE